MIGEVWTDVRGRINERLTRNWTPHALPNQSPAPLVSFSFDDFPRSAAKAGAEILGEFRIKGTYFVAGARAGQRAEGLEHFTDDDLARLARDGHEIGCHTFTHASLPKLTTDEIDRELLRNKEYVRRVLGDYKMTSFAYPFGHATIAVKAYLRRFFPVCRGVWSRVNKGSIDFSQLKAVELKQPFDPKRIEKVLDETTAASGWTIFFTHDVSDHPNYYRCAPRDLARVVKDVLDRKIEVLPVSGAAARVGFVHHA
jgi:peptidoglycan/xylan/chitin deacetylase (PgdA/CDA1 family)